MGWIFVPLIIAAIIVTIVVMRNPEQEKTEEQKKDATLAAKVLSVVINLIFAVAGFVGTVFGLLFMSPYPLINFGQDVEPKVQGGDFLFGLFLIVISIVVPVIANLLLHRFWYSKCSLSKKWIYIPMAIITVGLLLICVIMAADYMNGWVKAIWYW